MDGLKQKASADALLLLETHASIASYQKARIAQGYAARESGERLKRQRLFGLTTPMGPSIARLQTTITHSQPSTSSLLLNELIEPRPRTVYLATIDERIDYRLLVRICHIPADFSNESFVGFLQGLLELSCLVFGHQIDSFHCSRK
jgi:hypothetical protein